MLTFGAVFDLKPLPAVPVRTAWRFLRLRKEERPPVCRVEANILKKVWWTADKGWTSSSLGVGRVAKNTYRKNWHRYETYRGVPHWH